MIIIFHVWLHVSDHKYCTDIVCYLNAYSAVIILKFALCFFLYFRKEIVIDRKQEQNKRDIR